MLKAQNDKAGLSFCTFKWKEKKFNPAYRGEKSDYDSNLLTTAANLLF